MARVKKSAPSSTSDAVASYKHPAKRKNIPLAGLEAQGVIREAPKIRHEYNPHLPPVLRSATDAAAADQLPELLAKARERPLSEDEATLLANALRRYEPWLEWSGKREKPWFEVDPVALHLHERISTQAILRVLAREDVQRDLFADPQQSYAQAVQFYQHDVDWSNRMILGDSLQVMASLARREDLAGRVQMVYIDPPYGIKFASNFQPQLGQRDVKDRDQDLTREPEMVRAYRDTWTLGIHSYLAYLRDRLAMARELLADSGSIFVQISDENLHRVRCLMDEVFRPENFVAVIPFTKTTGFTPKLLSNVCDHLLWYGKDKEKVKFRRLYLQRNPIEDPTERYVCVETPKGQVIDLTVAQKSGRDTMPEGRMIKLRDVCSQGPGENTSWEYWGRSFQPPPNRHWSIRRETMPRFLKSGYAHPIGKSLMWKCPLDIFPYTPLTNVWTDIQAMGFGDEKLYVVWTQAEVVQRCLLMTTDPGDLVLDPTCGSGTTAYVAEQWGRRWITCDTSRVALALARQRLMTARFSYYQLRPLRAEEVQRNPCGTWLADSTGQISGKTTFKCKTAPHITLKSIARNTSLDPIFSKHEPILAARLQELNAGLQHVTTGLRQRLLGKLAEKQKREGKRSVTEAERRQWELPKTGWQEWDVPFEADPDWPQPLAEALISYRAAWRAKMNDVNEVIAANAEMEELVDEPEEIKDVVRVTGPFTMEGVIALEEGPDTPIGGAPGELETFDRDTADRAVANAEAHFVKILRLLKASGVDFPGNLNLRFSRLEPVIGGLLVHAEGDWMSEDMRERRVAVSIGPEVGNVTSYQVETAVRTANRRGYDDLVFAGYGFDAAAQSIVEESSHPNLRLHMALIRPDVAMGDLLKTQPGSQIFTVFSAPRVRGPELQKDGLYVVEVEGMDVYDPVSNTLFPTNKERIAAWFLDSDYDGRTFCVCQAFFPDKSKWDKLAKALGKTSVINEEWFEALSGLNSLPFPRPVRLGRGEPWRIAVKVIDPRGNEGLRVLSID